MTELARFARSLIIVSILISYLLLSPCYNQTLSRCLSKLCHEDHTKWDEKIDTVLMGYRASSQASTKHSPFFVLHQEQMRLPIDVDMMPTQLDSDRLEEEDLDGTLDVLLAKREEIFDKVEKNISDAQQKQKVALLGRLYHQLAVLVYLWP